jgi:hypothetical protein
MKGSNTYQERNSIESNQGEDIFLAWCKEKKLRVTRLGFDEKKAPVDRFYELPLLVRNLPDFIVTSDSRLTLVNVKGSLNFKENEYQRLDQLIETYETPSCVLYYAFALPSEVIWKRAASIKTAYEQATHEGVWPDGKVYRKLYL